MKRLKIAKEKRHSALGKTITMKKDIMASSKQKLTAKGLLICDKCGSVMITRKLATKNSDKVKFIQINQCVVCRHYTKI